MLLGDLNFDVLQSVKCQKLLDICDLFDLANVIRNATCFVKGEEPSLVDVILTNRKHLISTTVNFDTCLSDWHHMICTVIK